MHNPEIIIVPAIFLFLFLIIKTLSNNRLKRQLIEKGLVDGKLSILGDQQESNPMASLKWGLVLTGIGLAIFVSRFMDFRDMETATLGLTALFAGIGFLIYYKISTPEQDK